MLRKTAKWFDSLDVKWQGTVVVSIVLALAGILAAVVIATDHNYTRDQAVQDANAFCAPHDGVEGFDYSYRSDGHSQVICKDGALAVFP